MGDVSGRICVQRRRGERDTATCIGRKQMLRHRPPVPGAPPTTFPATNLHDPVPSNDFCPVPKYHLARTRIVLLQPVSCTSTLGRLSVSQTCWDGGAACHHGPYLYLCPRERHGRFPRNINSSFFEVARYTIFTVEFVLVNGRIEPALHPV
jgi:hypothetical protein